MKATIVLMGDTSTQNYGAKMMLKANRLGDTGFEMARLPFHVSLKQPFSIGSLEEFEKFFDEFAATVKPLTLSFEKPVLFPNNAIGGIPSGCIVLRAEKTTELESLQKRLFDELTERFGPCPAAFDDNYIFHMTIAIGKAPYENYLRSFETIVSEPIEKTLRFDKLAFFYYDDDRIAPGTYFCYKAHDLK